MKQLLGNLISRIRQPKPGFELLEDVLVSAHLQAAFVEQTENVSSQSVLRWDEFGHGSALDPTYLPPGQVRGWDQAGYEYAGSLIDIPEIRAMGQTWSEVSQFDISEVSGLTGSKGDLSKYRTLDAFAIDRCQDKISELSPEKLQINLAHNEIRILQDEPGDFFMRFLWDERLWLCNAGGSHHFAAARHIAIRIGCKVPITGRLVTQAINPVAVEGLGLRFRAFLVSSEARALGLFKNTLRTLQVPYYTLPKDTQQPQGRVILFPTADEHSLQAAQLLDKHGFVDVVSMLQSIVAQQTLVGERLKTLKQPPHEVEGLQAHRAQ